MTNAHKIAIVSLIITIILVGLRVYDIWLSHQLRKQNKEIIGKI